MDDAHACSEASSKWWTVGHQRWMLNNETVGLSGRIDLPCTIDDPTTGRWNGSAVCAVGANHSSFCADLEVKRIEIWSFLSFFFFHFHFGWFSKNSDKRVFILVLIGSIGLSARLDRTSGRCEDGDAESMKPRFWRRLPNCASAQTTWQIIGLRNISANEDWCGNTSVSFVLSFASQLLDAGWLFFHFFFKNFGSWRINLFRFLIFPRNILHSGCLEKLFQILWPFLKSIFRAFLKHCDGHQQKNLKKNPKTHVWPTKLREATWCGWMDGWNQLTRTSSASWRSMFLPERHKFDFLRRYMSLKPRTCWIYSPSQVKNVAIQMKK